MKTLTRIGKISDFLNFFRIISPALALMLLSISYSSLAHFGSKGPYGGSVSCGIAYDSTVYLGSAEGGVYQSANSKIATWSPRPVGLKSGKITALVHTGKYLIAGTADSGVYIFNGFIKTDRFWKKINNGLGNLKITSLVAIDSITVLAGTNGGGIYKTTNKGKSWVAVNNAELHHMEITGIVKAGNRIIHIAYDGGAYASDDLGATWFNFNDEQTDDVEGTLAISYNEKTGEILLYNGTGLYKASSAATSTSPDYNLAENGLPENIIVRSISNDGDNWYLATNKGVYQSPSGSVSWTAVNTGLSTNDVTTVIPFRGMLIAGTKGEGVFKATIPVSSWSAANTGFNNLKTFSIAASGDAVVVAATERGVYVSRDLATNYTPSNKGLTDSLNVNDLVFAGTKLLAGTRNNGFFESSDTGKTWSAVNDGIISMNILKVYYFNGRTYGFDHAGTVYSRGAGSSWNIITAGLPDGVRPSSLGLYGNKLLLTTQDHGVFVKEEKGVTWQAMNKGLTNLAVTSSATLGKKIYIGTSGSGVFVSDTAAIDWLPTAETRIDHTDSMGLDGNYIQAMNSFKGYVFASYKGGVLATSDEGQTWIPGGNQFNLPSYTDVNKIDFVTTRVFVTTQFNGLYSNALSELPPVVTQSVIKGKDNQNGLLAVVPNPNNGNFQVSSALKISHVAVYDFSGKLMQVTNALDLYSLNLSAGIYFLQVNTAEGIISEKMIVE
jgi:photosystem II stability/assembly factor-like uncharacterized protein